MAERESATPAITFRPLAPDDLPTLHRWLSNPRVYRWYGGVPPPLAEVAERYAPRTLAASSVRPFLILHDDAPIGYIQSYLLADDPEYAAIVGDAAGAAALDVLIGEDASVGRGLGTASVRAFLRAIIFAAAGTTRCFSDPQPESLVAIGPIRARGSAPCGDMIRHRPPCRAC